MSADTLEAPGVVTQASDFDCHYEGDARQWRHHEWVPMRRNWQTTVIPDFALPLETLFDCQA
jgi:hypothetical protein